MVRKRFLRVSWTMRLSPLIRLQGAFFLNAFAIASWLPRIPDVKAALGLDVWSMSLCLMGMPAGTMVGFLFAARVSQAVGLRRTTSAFGALACLALILPAFAPGPVLLTASLSVFGLITAQIEVSMNAKANEMQRTLERRIMSRCHALWSFGAMAGGVVSGGFSEWGIPFAAQQMAVLPVAAALAWTLAEALPDDAPQVPAKRPKPGYARPSAALLVLCLIPISALLIEGAMLDWSVLYLRDEVGIRPLTAAVAFSVFAGAMGLGRLTGDWVTEVMGVSSTMIVSSLAMSAGIAAFVLSPGILTAAPAAALAGFGAANIYPLAMSLAPEVPGSSPEGNVATVALTAFSAFLLGPPLIGFLGDTFSLAVGLGALAPIALMPAGMVWLGFLTSAPRKDLA